MDTNLVTAGMRSSHSRRLGLALVFALALAIGLGPLSDRADAAHASSTGGLYFCVSSKSVCQASFSSVAKGTPVTMVCWRLGRGATGAYWTDKWFYVTLADGREGFIHASRVGSQTPNRPGCSDYAWMRAADWALDQVGQTTIPAAYKNGNVATYWSSWCWLFSWDAWNFGAGQRPKYSAGTAYDTYRQYNAAGRVAAGAGPRGSLVWWGSSSPGHAAVSIGNGYVVGTWGSRESQMIPVSNYIHTWITERLPPLKGHTRPSLVP